MAGDDRTRRKDGKPDGLDLDFDDDLDGWGASPATPEEDDFGEKTPTDYVPAPRRPVSVGKEGRVPRSSSVGLPGPRTARPAEPAEPAAHLAPDDVPLRDGAPSHLMDTMPLEDPAPRRRRPPTGPAAGASGSPFPAPEAEIPDLPPMPPPAPVAAVREAAPVAEPAPAPEPEPPAALAPEPATRVEPGPPARTAPPPEDRHDQPPPPIDVIPLDEPPPAGENTWLTSFQLFKAESQRLARVGNWRKLAAMTGCALLRAPYSRRMTRNALLLDLARIYRDRLNDETRAEQAFAVLADEDPANAEALVYLGEIYERRAEWGDIYDLHLKKVEATWDPNERLTGTRKAAELALDKLGDPALAIKAWELLWNLGDGAEEASRELSRLYRLAGRWMEMAAFLERQVERLQGGAQLVVLRELAEVKLSGLRDPDGASTVLEKIVERSPKDPIATLQLARVYAQRADWPALIRLGEQAATREGRAAGSLDLQHLVADSLWQAGKREEAIAAYDRILAVDPADHDGTTRKRDFLTQSGRSEELLALLVAKVEVCDEDTERATLLGQAADLAERQLKDPSRAIALWEQRIEIEPEDLPSFEALARLGDAMGDLRGVARALEGQLALTREPQRRIRLLAQLGEHYAARLGEDDRAEGCWKEVLSLDPSDISAREELIRLHRRRGDFESLNSALMRQIWLSAETERAEKLSRVAAENLDENFHDPHRSIEAWRRVLDFSPADLQALRALVHHYTSLGARREVIATLERQILAVDDIPTKIGLALQVARLWSEEALPQAAAAAYERILRWNPHSAEALDGVVQIYRAAGQAGRAAGVLEHAAALTLDPRARADLLRRTLALFPAEDHGGRFYHLRRILRLAEADRPVVEELKVEAEAAGLWPEMAALLTQLACQASSPAARRELLRELAGVCETKLDHKVRALLALEGVLLSGEDQHEVMAEAVRLARGTGRFEDLLTILDRLTTPDFELRRRKEAVLERAAICEKDLKDPARAFQEARRVLELDPSDWAPLSTLERLAESHGLWAQLDAVCAELGDRSASTVEQLDLLERRERVAREKLDAGRSAFDLLVRRYRLNTADLTLLRQLTTDAEALKGWDWLLPLLEATQLYSGEQTTAQELAATAALYETKLQDHEHAFTLCARAFVGSPETVDLATKLEELAARTGRHDLLADAFRTAAAVSTRRDQTIDLLRRVASIYEEKLDAAGRAIDIHRRLLTLKEDEMRSLEVLIAWHRGRTEWRDLRDRLRQWVRLAPPAQDRIPKLLEIAQVSEQHLADPEMALETFGDVVELDSDNHAAHQGLNGLVLSLTEPGLRLRWLRMELRNAAGQKSADLRLEIAQILAEDMGDESTAVETLRDLLQDTGPTGPGFDRLHHLLAKAERWKDLVLLLQDKAEAADDESTKLATLEDAISVCHEHLADAEESLRERLYRGLLKLNPTDRELRMLLSRLLRNAGRFEELCQHIDEGLPHLTTTEARISALHERGTLQALNLGRLSDAEATWQTILSEAPKDEGAVLALARAAAQRGDTSAYVARRQQQARLLPPREAALVLCHLAEVCEESEGPGDKMISFYREARALDPNNVPAMEALKGIGRRLKNLRPTAALLPFEGERELSVPERAKRLKTLGDGSFDQNLQQAIEWYRRATAVDPDNPDLWAALAQAMVALPSLEDAHRAHRAWLEALERSEPTSPSTLKTRAERLYQVALSARSTGETAAYGQLVRTAYELVPHHAPSAIATAEAMIEARDVQAAQRLLHTILTQHRSELTEDQTVTALFSRGLTLRTLGQQDQAIEDIREVLRLRPLHADALVAIGELQATSGRIAAALEYQIRALMVVQDPQARARLFYRLGVLWEDGLRAKEEAGACYELALAEGLSDRDLLHRALRHFQRSGRLDQSLEVVNGLLPTSRDSEELATLWLVRGEIFAAREGQEDQAIEAFDMALSYNPALQDAREGLTVVLERRGDWTQLLQVLEATCDVGSPVQQSTALQRMADICSVKLGDPDRSEEYLRRAVQTFPTREALEQLERVYSADSGRVTERKEILGLLVGFGPPWFERAIDLSRILLLEEKPWAWCLISPLLGVSQVDPETKAVLQAMRKEYERPPLLCCGLSNYELLRHPKAHPALTEVLAQLGGLLKPLGGSSIQSLGDGGAVAISETTSLGKTFAGVAEIMGVGGASLHRTQELPESVCVVSADPNPQVVVRTEVIQQLVHAEVGFLFAYALELAKPGHRVMAAFSPQTRDHLVAALWLALGFTSSVDRHAAKLAERVRETVDEDTRSTWADSLAELSGHDPVEVGRTWWNGVSATARRAGLLAGADLRQAFRVVSRIEPEVPRPRVVARLDELDEYIAASTVLQDLVSFAASPAFGKLLSSGIPALDT